MRRLFKALMVGCAVVVVLVLILAPILPYNVANYGPCCGGIDGQSVAFKYLGYGFLTGWSSPSSVELASTSHYYVWCHNLGNGYSCLDGFSFG